MKLKLLIIVIFLLSLTISTKAQSKIQGFASKGGETVVTNGLNSTSKFAKVYVSCTVTVYDSGTTTLSTIFSDALSTPKSNPFTADSLGYWFFYANNGTYDVQFSGTGITVPFTLTGFKIGDASSGVGGSGTANRVAKFTSTSAIGNSIITDNGTSIGINNTSPSASALLELTSTTQGLRFPNMTTTQRDAIVSPQLGLMIYNTTTSAINVYNGSWGSVGASGITTINTLTAATQTFAFGSSGTAPNVSSVTSTHTFNFPLAATGVTSGTISNGTQSIVGNKTFTGLTTLGTGTYEAAAPALVATPVSLVVADSNSASPTTSNSPTAAFETWRSNNSTVIAYPFTLVKSAGEGEIYNIFAYSLWNPNMSGFLTDVNHVNLRSDLFMQPTNIGARQIVGYGAWLRAGRGQPSGGSTSVSGFRAVGAQIDAWNNTASQVDFDASTINSTIGLAINTEPGLHNSVAIIIQAASKSAAWSNGYQPSVNSIYRHALDLTAATFEFTGTVGTTTNTINGSSTIFLTEAVVGDQVKLSGGATWYTVTVRNSDTSLTVTPDPGATGGGQTLTKAVKPIRLAAQAFIGAQGTGGDFRLVGLDAVTNNWRFDPDAKGSVYGSYISFGTNTIAAPSDTLTSGWRTVLYAGGGGANYGFGVESGSLWAMSPAGYKVYVSSSTSPVLGMTVDSTGIIAFKTTTISDSAGKILSAALNTVAIAQGGTGQVTANAGFNALSPMTTAGDIIYGGASGAGTRLAAGTTSQVLIGGTTPSWGAVALASMVSGTLPVANGGTGITSFGTGIATWLGTPSSANLATAVTDETGSNLLVFNTSPTLVTPNIGVATGTSLSLGGNITMTANAARIIADMSTATTSNRFAFQTSTASGSTVVGFIPGAGTVAYAGTSAFRAFNSTDMSDSAFAGFLINSAGVQISSTRQGSGATILPMQFVMASTVAMVLGTNNIFSMFYGADVADAASITPTGNTFTITGSGTNIATIVTTGITAGTTIRMITTSAITFDETGNITLNGAGTTLTTVAGDIVQATWDGTKWRLR